MPKSILPELLNRILVAFDCLLFLSFLLLPLILHFSTFGKFLSIFELVHDRLFFFPRRHGDLTIIIRGWLCLR